MYMLKKNIYIIYPAGYYGTYISWAINMSDADLSKETVLNPLNDKQSDAFGGVGTSHNHIKVPTHQGPFYHFMWVMHNKPTEYKIYNISKGNDSNISTEMFISVILNSDPDSIFINIHNGNNGDITSFGDINGITKWPTQLAVKKLYSKLGAAEVDPFTCATDVNFRNMVAIDKDVFFRRQVPIEFPKLIQVMEQNGQWYSIRNKMQPQEINEETYINPATYLVNDEYRSRIFELTCFDVVQSSFPEFLKDFLEKSNVSSSYDTSCVSSFQQEFMEAQVNLQWFESIKNWREHRIIDDFIRSHCGIQGILLHEMMKEYPALLETNWKEMTIDEINEFIKSTA
jgi:hypothetical protein